MSEGPGRSESDDSERLPWLEPYRDPAKTGAAKPSKPTPNRGGLLIPAMVVGLVAALGGGYWIGQRSATPSAADTAPSQAAVTQSTPATQPPAELPGVESAKVEKPQEVTAEAKVEAVKAPSAKASKSGARTRARSHRTKRIRHADTRKAQYDRVVAKQQEAARTWPKMPSPGPAGQVIQLGAFTTRGRAEAAYRERLARYPLLSGMPQVIVPVITQPKGQVLYVLRLGTQSRDQSNTVCRNLENSGDHCLVIG